MKLLASTTSIIDHYETYFAAILARTFSSGKNTPAEEILIKNRFVLFLNVLISFYIVYNWYFIMFFLDESGKRVPTFDLSLEKMQQYHPVLHILFKYTFCVLSMIIPLLLDKLPKLISYIKLHPNYNRRIQFIALFCIVLFIVINLGSSIFDSVSNPDFVGIYCILFIVYGIYTFVVEFTNNDPIAVASRMKKYYTFGQLTPLLHILLFFLRIIWSITIVSLTAISNCIYFVFTSFFAVFFYSNKSLYGTFKMINSFILASDSTRDNTSENNIFQIIAGYIIENIYTFLFEIFILIAMVISLYDYSANIHTKKLQFTMISLCSIVIFIVLFVAFQRFSSNPKIQPIISPNIIPDPTISPILNPIISPTVDPIISPTLNAISPSINANVLSAIKKKIPSNVPNVIKNNIKNMIPFFTKRI